MKALKDVARLTLIRLEDELHREFEGRLSKNRFYLERRWHRASHRVADDVRGLRGMP